MPIIAQRKEELRNLLALRDWEQLKTWSKGQRNVMSSLLALLFEPDPLLAWRAIEALGVMAPENRQAQGHEHYPAAVLADERRIGGYYLERAGSRGGKSAGACRR